MANHSWLDIELADGVSVVLCDLLDPFVGKDLWVILRLGHGFWVIGPAWRERGIAFFFEERAPVIPAGGEEIEAVDEHDGLQSRGVGALDVLLFTSGKIGHGMLLWFSSR